MQVRPLFHDDLETLKAALRLTGADTKGDAQAVIEDCVRGFKVWFARRAGFPRQLQLQGVTYTDDPSTELEAQRLAARVLEVKWVWCECLKRLQSMFADASGSAFAEYNDQGVWRQIDSFDRSVLQRQCLTEIESLMCFVMGDQGIGEDVDVQCFDGTTDAQECYFPGGSVFPHLGKWRGNVLVPAVRFDEVL